MSLKLKIEIDIERDVRDHLRNEVIKLGYQYAGPDDLNTIATKFLMLKARLIPASRRIVEIANDLQVPEDLKKGFEAFRRQAESGNALYPYQSKKIDDEAFIDSMFVEWGIQHFHLGESLESDGFVSRTDPLLFALVTNSHVYCIGFWSHGEWADTEIVGKIHDNWPETIAKFRATSVVELACTPSSADLKTLRRNGVSAFFEPRPGVIYGPIAGGQTTTGHSARAMMHAVKLLKSAREAERQAVAYLEANAPPSSAKILATGHLINRGQSTYIEVLTNGGVPVARVPI